MKQYTVTGMSCAACSSRVEKAVSKVPGVTACSVSLLTNSMGVEGDVPPETVIHAVEDAGYGASLKGQGTAAQAQSASEAEDALKDRETPVLKHRLIASLGFLAVLMYMSMGHMMWGWPLPHFFDGNHIAMGYQWFQGTFTPRPEHGHAGSTWFWRVVYLQHICVVCDDGRTVKGQRHGSHVLHA